MAIIVVVQSERVCLPDPPLLGQVYGTLIKDKMGGTTGLLSCSASHGLVRLIAVRSPFCTANGVGYPLVPVNGQHFIQNFVE